MLANVNPAVIAATLFILIGTASFLIGMAWGRDKALEQGAVIGWQKGYRHGRRLGFQLGIDVAQGRAEKRGYEGTINPRDFDWSDPSLYRYIDTTPGWTQRAVTDE